MSSGVEIRSNVGMGSSVGINPPAGMLPTAMRHRKAIRFASLPPLALYIHLPWCMRKCPYCDFNSHEQPASLSQAAYIRALIADLESQLPMVWGRSITSIFIGGGTPSLFDPDVIGNLLSEVRARLKVAPDAEITMEANPGSFEAARFRGFKDAGVNRLSIGIQSFDDQSLVALGRVHDRRQAIAAAELAMATFAHVNLDVMFGLPKQSLDGALADIDMVLSLHPKHLSCYQLTLEPNTRFAVSPPPHLPDDDLLADMQAAVIDRLGQAGLARYEISAYAADGHQCQHNLNYWNFGDYLGIGAGAHGKISSADRIVRTVKRHHPDQYIELYDPQHQASGHLIGKPITLMQAADDAPDLAANEGIRIEELAHEALPFEFMLNALRLIDGVPASRWREHTGTEIGDHPLLLSALALAQSRGLMATDPLRFRASPRGLELLSDLQEMFIPPA